MGDAEFPLLQVPLWIDLLAIGTGALAGAALNLARSAGSTNAACEAQVGPQPSSDGDVWK